MAARDAFGNVMLIPPNGFAGAAQQSAAVRHHLSTATSHVSRSRGHTTSVKRPRKKAGHAASGRSPSTKTRKPRKSKGGMTILKAGSAAALAWGKKMAKAKRAKAAKVA